MGASSVAVRSAVTRCVPLSRDTKIFIAGHTGLVGSALWRYFQGQGFGNLVCRTSAELDLRDDRSTANFFAETRPEVVINAAALVGGIAANASRPAEFFSDNLRIQLNLLDSALAHGVERFLFLSSSCVYPKYAAQPIRETELRTGELEATNSSFAMAKLAGMEHLRGIRRQFGVPYICAMPTNLYGPNDDFGSSSGHVLPALLRRFHEAKQSGATTVTCWGSGRPRREFLYVDDFAKSCHVLLERYDDDLPINVGTGRDVTIAELAGLIAEVVDYQGEILWDAGKPDGTFQKVLDVERVERLGWTATTELDEGIRETYAWFLAHQETCRR